MAAAEGQHWDCLELDFINPDVSIILWQPSARQLDFNNFDLTATSLKYFFSVKIVSSH
jgi:hypothetical protein